MEEQEIPYPGQISILILVIHLLPTVILLQVQPEAILLSRLHRRNRKLLLIMLIQAHYGLCVMTALHGRTSGMFPLGEQVRQEGLMYHTNISQEMQWCSTRPMQVRMNLITGPRLEA